MHNKRYIFPLALLMTLPLAGCSNGPLTDTGLGTNPTIPEADSSLIPTVNVASAKGWHSKKEIAARPWGALSACSWRPGSISAGTAGEAARDADQSRDGDGGEPARSQSESPAVYLWGAIPEVKIQLNAFHRAFLLISIIGIR